MPREEISWSSIRDGLPPGEFEFEESDRGLLVLRRESATELRAVGFGLSSDGRGVPLEHAGRRPLLELRVGEHRFLLRRFHHGGLLRVFSRGRFRDRARPFTELVLAERLAALGIRTPRVVAARARRAPLLGWELALVTLRVEGAKDFGAQLAEVRRGRRSRRTLRPALEAVARCIRRLHDARFLHADLHPHNLLVGSEKSPEVWVLDLDRSRFLDELGEEDRGANLARLYRHVLRRDDRDGPSITRADCLRFLTAYGREGEDWKARFGAIADQHVRRDALHRAGWGLERLFGGRITGGGSD